LLLRGIGDAHTFFSRQGWRTALAVEQLEVVFQFLQELELRVFQQQVVLELALVVVVEELVLEPELLLERLLELELELLQVLLMGLLKSQLALLVFAELELESVQGELLLD
jgi:hypothetical protein